LRALVVEKPGQAGEQAVGEFALQPVGWCRCGDEAAVAVQGGQLAECLRPALFVDAVQRPVRAQSAHVAHRGVAAASRLADAHHPRTGRCQCARDAGLAGAQCLAQFTRAGHPAQAQGGQQALGQGGWVAHI